MDGNLSPGNSLEAEMLGGYNMIWATPRLVMFFAIPRRFLSTGQLLPRKISMTIEI